LRRQASLRSAIEVAGFDHCMQRLPSDVQERVISLAAASDARMLCALRLSGRALRDVLPLPLLGDLASLFASQMLQAAEAAAEDPAGGGVGYGGAVVARLSVFPEPAFNSVSVLSVMEASGWSGRLAQACSALGALGGVAGSATGERVPLAAGAGPVLVLRVSGPGIGGRGGPAAVAELEAGASREAAAAGEAADTSGGAMASSGSELAADLARRIAPLLARGRYYSLLVAGGRACRASSGDRHPHAAFEAEAAALLRRTYGGDDAVGERPLTRAIFTVPAGAVRVFAERQWAVTDRRAPPSAGAATSGNSSSSGGSPPPGVSGSGGSGGGAASVAAAAGGPGGGGAPSAPWVELERTIVCADGVSKCSFTSRSK
jgi:hypothetical protein